MIMQAEAQRTYSPEEYLELEVNSAERHEYRDGEITLMAGGTPNHNTVAGNLHAALNFALKRSPDRVFVADQRLWIPEKRIYVYPDVMVVAGELQLQEGRTDTISNPVMIAEVLSGSTQGYDRGDKFAAYRTIPTLQEYLLIDQYTMHVEQYAKTDANKWIFSEYDGLEATFSLVSVPFNVELADVYDKVDFAVEA